MPKYGQSSAHFNLNLDRSNFGLSPLSLPNWYWSPVLEAYGSPVNSFFADDVIERNAEV